MVHAEINRSASGCEPAEWLARHGDALFRHALMRVRDEHVAEELVQETLLAAMGSVHTFAGRAAERTWLIGILRHKVVDGLRRRRRESAAFDDAALERHCEAMFTASGKWIEEQAAPRSGADRAMIAREFRRAFAECLEMLPARTAAAFVLTELDGWEGARACEALGVTAPNYWALMSRARLHLRQCLREKDVLGDSRLSP